MNILVVDDSQAIRRLLVRRLQTMDGIHVVGEASGEAQAAALASSLKPDTVLLDFSLAAGDSGLEVLNQLKREGFTGRILMMTSQSHCRQSCLDAGADGFYDKASGLETLFSDLTGMLDGAHQASAALPPPASAPPP